MINLIIRNFSTGQVCDHYIKNCPFIPIATEIYDPYIDRSKEQLKLDILKASGFNSIQFKLIVITTLL